MKKSALGALPIGALIITASDTFAKEAKIWAGLGSVSVKPYIAKPISHHSKIIPARKSYVHAVFSHVQNTISRSRFESEAGIKFLGVHDVIQGHIKN